MEHTEILGVSIVVALFTFLVYSLPTILKRYHCLNSTCETCTINWWTYPWLGLPRCNSALSHYNTLGQCASSCGYSCNSGICQKCDEHRDDCQGLSTTKCLDEDGDRACFGYACACSGAGCEIEGTCSGIDCSYHCIYCDEVSDAVECGTAVTGTASGCNACGYTCSFSLPEYETDQIAPVLCSNNYTSPEYPCFGYPDYVTAKKQCGYDDVETSKIYVCNTPELIMESETSVLAWYDDAGGATSKIIGPITIEECYRSDVCKNFPVFYEPTCGGLCSKYGCNYFTDKSTSTNVDDFEMCARAAGAMPLRSLTENYSHTTTDSALDGTEYTRNIYAPYLATPVGYSTEDSAVFVCSPYIFNDRVSCQAACDEQMYPNPFTVTGGVFSGCTSDGVFDLPVVC